jgi:transketolase
MRTAFIEELTKLAAQNPRIFLVVGDLGYSVVEKFAQEFPNRFLNAGVAEQNMTGLAAGLASEGFHVFTYSIANFPTLRCLEQIRNDIAYHKLPVTVVSVGAGFAYGNLGYSHHAVQDLAVMRTLPEMTVLSPADPGETRQSLRWLSENPRPSYLRLGKAGEGDIYPESPVDRGPICVLRGESSAAIFASGSILSNAIRAATHLSNRGISLSVYSVPWISPVLPEISHRVNQYETVFTLEEHVMAGGLGSLIREISDGRPKVYSFAAQPRACSEVGSQTYLRLISGLDAEAVATQIHKILTAVSG